MDGKSPSRPRCPLSVDSHEGKKIIDWENIDDSMNRVETEFSDTKWFAACSVAQKLLLCDKPSKQRNNVRCCWKSSRGSERFTQQWNFYYATWCIIQPNIASPQQWTKESNALLLLVFTCGNLCDYFWMNSIWVSEEILEWSFNTFFASFQIANNPCANLLTAHFRLDGHPNVNYLEKVIQNASQSYLFFEPSQVVKAMQCKLNDCKLNFYLFRRVIFIRMCASESAYVKTKLVGCFVKCVKSSKRVMSRE